LLCSASSSGSSLAGELAELGVVEHLAIFGDLGARGPGSAAEGGDDGLELAALLVELLELARIAEDGRRAEQVVELGEAPRDRLQFLDGEHGDRAGWREIRRGRGGRRALTSARG
jgi:hypothetical protein